MSKRKRTVEEPKRRGLLEIERAEEPKRKRRIVKLDRLDLFGIRKTRQFEKTSEWEKEFLITLKFAGLFQSFGKVHFEDGDFIKEIEDSPSFSVNECVKCDGRKSWLKMRKKIARDFKEREAAGLTKQPRPPKLDRILTKFNKENRRR